MKYFVHVHLRDIKINLLHIYDKTGNRPLWNLQYINFTNILNKNEKYVKHGRYLNKVLHYVLKFISQK